MDRGNFSHANIWVYTYTHTHHLNFYLYEKYLVLHIRCCLTTEMCQAVKLVTVSKLDNRGIIVIIPTWEVNNNVWFTHTVCIVHCI